MATQELAQKVCQQYGWSARFAKEDSDDADGCGYWCCYVTVGFAVATDTAAAEQQLQQRLGVADERKFTSHNNTSPDTTVEGKKQGMAAAAQAALEGLQEELARQEAKPKLALTELFFPLHHNNNSSSSSSSNSSSSNNKPPPPFVIRGSSPHNWDHYIWNNKPNVVGIDTEGNQSHPPILVQIATDDCVLLEITSMLGNRLSDNLQRLLADNDIVKVFCDNYAHHDKRSLGLLPPLTTVSDKKNKDPKKRKSSTRSLAPQDNHDFSKGPILDLEVLTSNALGPVKVARGLSRIVTLSMPELNVVVGKPPSSKGGRFKDIGRFTLIEQKKAPPLSSLRDLSRKDQHYAAVDAWATLQAYKRLSAIQA